MEWILRSPQIHSTFGNLGYAYSDGYHVNEYCNETLSNILHNLLNEDKYLRTYRKSISFGQYVQKDIIPLLIHCKDDKTTELLISILAELTVPVQCLLSFGTNSKTDFERHTIFEINNLLASIKDAFIDQRVTKILVEFLKKNLDFDNLVILSPEQCKNTGNGLLLLRNILHIPCDANSPADRTLQNQIIWNIFSQGIDKVLIKLMTIPEACQWSVSMVQLIALLYKEQHALTLRKLLNLWLEEPLSASSEDNESNTSPQNRSCENSSQMLTSDPTSDSSDTNGSAKNSGDNSMGANDNNDWTSSPDPHLDTIAEANTTASDANWNSTAPEGNAVANVRKLDVKTVLKDTKYAMSDVNLTALEAFDLADAMRDECGWPPPPPAPPPASPADRSMFATNIPGTNTKRKLNYSQSSSGVDDSHSEASLPSCSQDMNMTSRLSGASDCGYMTQVDNQEAVSTSSNEDDDDDDERCKRAHQKPLHPKQKPNTKARIGNISHDRKKKKVLKRAKSTIINVQGLYRRTPTDDDVANIMKEFTVDFLLKGYNSLVQTLHNQILMNANLEMDMSHFFWLITFFLKFATQIELGVERLSAVLSFDLLAYLTAAGVRLCEQTELARKLHHTDLKPTLRSLHLVVTSIREFLQAVEVFGKQSGEGRQLLAPLGSKLAETSELRQLLLLLLRHYDCDYHNRQYLQDLIVTNHILLSYVDNFMKVPGYKGKNNMARHLEQFATPEMMGQYALLLEDYEKNGEFVNDCIFTMMHHVAGDLHSLLSLFQPKILKIFITIWKSDFEVCDDWTDLIHQMINTFIKRPCSLKAKDESGEGRACCDGITAFLNRSPSVAAAGSLHSGACCDRITAFLNQPPTVAAAGSLHSGACYDDDHSNDKWTEAEVSSLSWNFIQCNFSEDTIGEIVNIYKEDGILKSRDSVIKELYKQNLINKADLDTLLKTEKDANYQQIKDARDNDISKLCDQLIQDNKLIFLEWIQRALLDTCFAKIYLEKKAADNPCSQLKFECFKTKHVELPLISPVSYHSLLMNKAIPLVPWNLEQESICKDAKFLQLVHKLGFVVPAGEDSGTLFIGIPHTWSADTLYHVAGEIMPIDTSELNFSKNAMPDGEMAGQTQTNSFTLLADVIQKDVAAISSCESFYRIHKQYHQATMVNFTPAPGNSVDDGDESTEDIKKSWLEIVQRSQELKIAMQIKNEIKIQSESRVYVDLPTAVVKTTAPAQVMEAQSTDSSQSTDFLDNDDSTDSMCASASVASDLTRMYVSDEEEKPLQRARRVRVADDASGGASCSVAKRTRPDF